ncbi:MAG: pyridoxine 4-dehydrogenase [Actinoplanes sp.]|jgi:aryl-alcohol dehydrogenase-like predicted oxidoreductase|nr:pyridoxine 4-dehydrogenase [Actinoplanes sp.]
MQLAGPGAFGPPRNAEEALAVLRRAGELGVDHIDTAQYYGPDIVNNLIRQALYPYPENLVLVSKVGAKRDPEGRWLPALKPDELRSGVLDNLRSLGVDRLDAVNLRLMDGGLAFDDQLDAMVAIRDEGLIAGIGLSNITRAQLLHAVQRTEIVCVQNPFNLVERTSLPILRECEELGIAFVPFFPLGSAFGGVNPLLTHPGVVEVAARLAVTASQVALAWLLDQGDNVLLIPGTSSSVHLLENLTAGQVQLDNEARKALDAVTL